MEKWRSRSTKLSWMIISGVSIRPFMKRLSLLHLVVGGSWHHHSQNKVTWKRNTCSSHPRVVFFRGNHWHCYWQWISTFRLCVWAAQSFWGSIRNRMTDELLLPIQQSVCWACVLCGLGLPFKVLHTFMGEMWKTNVWKRGGEWKISPTFYYYYHNSLFFCMWHYNFYLIRFGFIFLFLVERI